MTKQDIINQIRMRRAFMKKRQSGAKRKPKHPWSLEREYKKILVNYINAYIEMVNQMLIAKLPQLEEQAKRLRPDGINTDGWVENLADIVNAMSIFFPQKTKNILRSIESMAVKVSDWNKDDTMAVIRSIVGVDVFLREPWLNDQLNSWIHDNTNYVIKALPTGATTQIQGIAQRGLAQGKSATAIGAEIQDTFGITKRRAEFIARDQVAKLNGGLTQLRHKELGVNEYIWRSMHDNRVRPDHVDFDGNTYKYDDPPINSVGAAYNPGQDYNCRCVAEPVLDNLLEKIR
jgi:SPP1 gp7 family putative phage head morphogenesis protein